MVHALNPRHGVYRSWDQKAERRQSNTCGWWAGDTSRWSVGFKVSTGKCDIARCIPFGRRDEYPIIATVRLRSTCKDS